MAMIRAFTIGAIALLASGGTAFAQGWTGPPVLVQQPLIDIPALNRDAARVNGKTETPAKTQAPRPAAAPISYKFIPSLAQRKQNFAGFVATAEQQSVGGGAKLQTLFDVGDVIVATGDVMAPLGLRADNVVDAFTFYLISNWMAVKRKTDWPPLPHVKGLREQIGRNLAEIRLLERAPMSEKQKTAEGLLIYGLITIGAVAGAEGNAKQMTAVSAQAAKTMRGMGFNIEATTLGAAGFEVAK